MKLDLAPFKTLIRERCGLAFDGSGADKLAAALRERMAELCCAGAADYRERLAADDGEFQELVNLLTINETYFFREPEQIRLCVDKLVPRLLAAGRAPLRILSAGCSSGEEPYSLAMALHDRYGMAAAGLFAIAGGDIDSTVLAKARAGRYAEFSFRGVPADLRARHFDKEKRHWRLKDELRAQVEFHEFNLFATNLPPALRGFDIVFFRNVSIYFDAPARRTILQNLAALMKDDGMLVTGTAETLANDLGVLPLVEEDGLFYFVKGTPPPPAPGVASEDGARKGARRADLAPYADERAAAPQPVGGASREVAGARRVPAAQPEAALPDLEAVRQLVREKRFDAALPQLERLLAAQPLDDAAQLLKAYIGIERREFAAAESALRQLLERQPWSVDALVLLGLAAKWQARPDDAIGAFRQAAYAHPACWPAHYYLAELYRAQGESDAALRAYRVALQLLSAAEPGSGIALVPLVLPAGEIRFLCERQLVKLGAAATAAAR